MKKFLTLVLVIAGVTGSFLAGYSTEFTSAAIITLPFGGDVLYGIPCTCLKAPPAIAITYKPSAATFTLLPIIGVTAATIVVPPGLSLASVWTPKTGQVGRFVPLVQSCWMEAFICFPKPTAGTAVYMGTALAPNLLKP